MCVGLLFTLYLSLSSLCLDMPYFLSFHQEYFNFLNFFSLLVFFLHFDLLCPVPLPSLMLITSLPPKKSISVIHIKVCILETSFPLFLIIDSVLMDLPSLTRSLCSAPCWLLSPVPFFSPRMSLGSPVLDLHNCCPASSIMNDSSLAYFISYFLAFIVVRQKSIFYLLLDVLTNFKIYKIKVLLQLLRILCRFPPLPIRHEGDFGEWGGRRSCSHCELLGFKALYKVKYKLCLHNLGFCPSESLTC